MKIIKRPYPHILVNSRKQIHGWWPGRRECTGERLLLNPYNGCSFNCRFCYANALGWGYFKLFARQKIVAVWPDFDLAVAKMLDKMPVAACGYLSPVSDPFQPLNQKYRLTEKLIRVFLERDLPVEIITKGVISEEALSLLAQHPKSFAQVSILTPWEKLRRHLVRGVGAASTEALFGNLKRIKASGIYAVLRIDPIIPFVTDSPADLLSLLDRAAALKVNHVVASVLDLPLNIYRQSLQELKYLQPTPPVKYEDLFTEVSGYSRHARLDYREALFTFLRTECEKRGLSFALCMEFAPGTETATVPTAAKKFKVVREVGLNRKFQSGCINCEGQDVPMYIKAADGFHFMPAADCAGACLHCQEAKCGLPALAMGKSPQSRKDFTYRDYLKRFPD